MLVGFYLAAAAETIFGVKFWAEFTREALAAIAGAGFGAWLGAWLAFRLERRKAADDRSMAGAAAALELAGRRATAGNLAIFGLSQIYNDLAIYKRQFLDPANRSPAPWFWLPPTTVAERNYYRFDVPSLAFLFQSKTPGAPEMVMKLALEQDRFATWLETLQIRARFHEQFIPPIIERLQREQGSDKKYTDAELQDAVGLRIYAELRNYYSDIDTLLHLGLKSSKELGDELRRLLVAELAGQTIIGFERADEVGGGSPLMQARNEAARNERPLPPRPAR
jgi:hypothetical protein